MIALRFQREKQLVAMRTRKLALGAFRFDVRLQFIERPMLGAAMLTAIRFAVNVLLLDVQCEAHEQIVLTTAFGQRTLETLQMIDQMVFGLLRCGKCGRTDAAFVFAVLVAVAVVAIQKLIVRIAIVIVVRCVVGTLPVVRRRMLRIVD